MNKRLLYPHMRAVLLGAALTALSAAASAQAFLTNLTVSPLSVVGGMNATGTITLSAATTTNLQIFLQSSNANLITVPSSVTVPANASSAKFTIITKPVTSQGTFGIFATQGKIQKSASLTLTVNTTRVKSVSLQPNLVTAGFTTIGTVTITQPAPAGGAVVDLSSDNIAVSVPSAITIPAGKIGCAFPVAADFGTACVANITASDLSHTSSAHAQLDVNALQFTTFDGPSGSPTTVNGVSNHDDVVGFTTQSNVNSNFAFSKSLQFTAIAIADPAASVNAINNSSVAVGVANGKAFSESAGVVTPITIPGATASVAFGINDAGAIVGQYTNGAGISPGFLYQNGTLTTLLPIPSATVVNAQGINNHGIVVGFYSINGINQFPFLYNSVTHAYSFPARPSTSRTIADGLVLTQLLGVNDNGIVCGYYQTRNGSQFGFVYKIATGKYTFFDAPQAAPVNGVQITQLVGISNDEIAGFYIDSNGQMHGVIAH